MTPIPCAVCGASINPERDIDPDEQRAFALHLQACALKVQVLIADRLNSISISSVEISQNGLAVKVHS